MPDATPLVLLPMPRNMTIRPERVLLRPSALITASPGLLFEAHTAQQALAGLDREWPIVAGSGYPHTGLELKLDPALVRPEAYRLTVADSGITIHGADAAGVYYGVCTLRQVLAQFGASLPHLEIDDWPDFAARGVMLDVSRDRVPTMETMYALIDRLAGWKINQFQLYMEHTFAYQHHPDVWALASPFTGQEILELDVYCRQRHIDLVPNQNSLGHMERWLKHPRYLPLAESPDGFSPPWGGWRPASTLDPQDPGSLELITSLYDELLPHFTSRLFNVGCDEPWELGQGKNKAAVAERGGRVYLDWLLKLYNEVTARGRQMQFWGDIIIHHPELVPALPKDAIVMEWGYEADHDFDGHLALFAQSGLPFYVCPGTSSWNSVAGRTENALGNLRAAAEAGLKHGAVGYLNTDWGDNGHWQTLSASALGFACGAAVAWAYEANRDIDLPASLDAFAFEDRAGIMGRLAYDLGSVYRMMGPGQFNSAFLFRTLLAGDDTLRRIMQETQADLAPDTLRQVIARLDAVIAPLDESQMQRPDAALVRAEFRQAADLLRHAARRLLLAQDAPEITPGMLLVDLDILLPRQRELWLARSRRGGLEDSMQRFEPMRSAYRAARG